MNEGKACFSLDGVQVPFEEGDTVLRAAQREGHYIPHLCWHEDLGQSGACRVCTVRVDGRLGAACTLPVRADMQVENRSDELDTRRRQLLQMLFAEGNHFCPGCEKSGDCLLQETARVMGMTGPHFEEFYPQRPVDASHADIWIDFNRCILCKLCLRASTEIDGKQVFAIGGHGIDTRLLINSPSGKLVDSALSADDAAAGICPVGAILPKRRGFVIPIHERRFDQSPLSVKVPEAPTATQDIRQVVVAARGAGEDTKQATVDASVRRPRIATVSLAGCFGCHMSLLDIDDRLLDLIDIVEFDRSPLTDIKQVGSCDIGLIEGGLCNAENVHVLREFRAACKVLVGVGACAITGGLPAQRNALDIGKIMQDVYSGRKGLSAGSQVPDDPELPLPLARVHAIQDVVHIDHFLPGCPPRADDIWVLLKSLLAGGEVRLPPENLHYD